MANNSGNTSKNGNFAVNGLLNVLKRFNAKERFYLVGHFLGNPNFTPNKKVLSDLENKLKIQTGTFTEVEVNNIFCAMDYHLDWLNGALELAFFGTTGDDRKGMRVTGSQEDIDLIIAFKTHGPKTYHLVLVEAKGVISFSNSQLKSKVNRLIDIFYENGKQRFEDIEVHMILAAPWKPAEGRLDWPPEDILIPENSFLSKTPEYIFLRVEENLLKIARSDNTKEWSRWRVDSRKCKETVE